MNDYKKLGFSKEIYYEFPNIINLEVYRGKCPCLCTHCPVGRLQPDQRKEYFTESWVSKELLEKIIFEMKKYSHSTIRLHSVGEPILWPELIPAIKFISKNQVKSWIFTSLVTEKKEILEALCLYCSIIEVSVNDTVDHEYLKNKGIDAFEKVIENIRYMANFIENNHLKTRLIVSRVESENLKEDEKFISYWKQTGLVADAFVRKYHNYNNILETKAEKQAQKVPCLVHWMRFNIACDGRVVVCFNELFKKIVSEEIILGNIYEETIYDIWHSNLYNKIRTAELSEYRSEKFFSKDFPCRNCFSCQSYDGKRETSEHQIELLESN